MRLAKELLSLLVRLFSGSLLDDLGQYAKREAKLAVISAGSLLAGLGFALGAAALGFAVVHSMLAPRIGTVASLFTLIGVCLALGLFSLLIGILSARSLPVPPTLHPPRLPAPDQLVRHARLGSEADEIAILLLSAVLEDLFAHRRQRR